MDEYLRGVAAVVSRRESTINRAHIASLERSLSNASQSRAHIETDGPAALIALQTDVASAVRQPISGGEGRFRLLFDGRLDYRDDLANRLEIQLLDTGQFDALLAVRAFERWGEAAIERLEGNFALIVWDRREKRLFAARDATGFYPLSYGLTDDLFVIASSPASVLAVTGAPRKINRQLILSHLAGLESTETTGVYQGISRLPAAHSLVVNADGMKLRRHWKLDAAAPLVAHASDKDYSDEARALLDRAVKEHMRSSGEVGADLTGGLDSSAVAITALDHLQRQTRLPVFTQVPEAGWDERVEAGRYGDETPFVREIAAMHPRLEPHFISTSLRSWDDGLRDYFRHGESIPSLPRWLTVWEQTFEIAKSKRLSVVLNGGGGNIGLSWEGRGAFVDWAQNRQWRKLLRELWAIAPGIRPFSRAFLSRVAVPLGPDWLWRLYTRMKFGAAGATWARWSLLHPDVAHSLRLEARAQELDVQRQRIRSYRDVRIEFLMADGGETAELCRIARASHGIDYRSPLQDRRLLEWCVRVPEEQFWRNGQPRWLMRRIMAGRLPVSVLGNRTRGAPGADWHFQMTRQLPFIREQVEVLCGDPDIASLIDFPRIRKLLDDWPEKTPVDAEDPLSYLLPAALPHALAVGQFIRWTKGANL